MRLHHVVLALAMVALPGAALACPNCFGTSGERVIEAYQRSTMFLSLLPFGIVAGIGGVAWWFAREGAARANAASQARRSPGRSGRRGTTLHLVRPLAPTSRRPA